MQKLEKFLSIHGENLLGKEKSGSTCAPILEMGPMVSSQAQHYDANGPHRGPAKWAVQK